MNMEPASGAFNQGASDNGNKGVCDVGVLVLHDGDDTVYDVGPANVAEADGPSAAVPLDNRETTLTKDLAAHKGPAGETESSRPHALDFISTKPIIASQSTENAPPTAQVGASDTVISKVARRSQVRRRRNNHAEEIGGRVEEKAEAASTNGAET